MYKIYQKLKEDGAWIPIIDVKLSKSKRVDRLFETTESAEYFINNVIKPENPDFVKVVEDEV